MRVVKAVLLALIAIAAVVAGFFVVAALALGALILLLVRRLVGHVRPVQGAPAELRESHPSPAEPIEVTVTEVSPEPPPR